jgi:hypothetical protein
LNAIHATATHLIRKDANARDTVEQLNLIFRKLARSEDKEIGNSLQEFWHAAMKLFEFSS